MSLRLILVMALSYGGSAMLPVGYDVSCFTMLSLTSWPRKWSEANLSSLKLFLLGTWSQ